MSAFDSDNSLRCPHCGRVEDDCIWELVNYDEGIHERDCGYCGAEYEYQTEVTYSFRSPRLGSRELADDEL